MHKSHTPLLLPTASFIAGCVIFGVMGSNIIAPLIIILIGGAIFLWRSWGVALLIIVLGLGGVRIAIYDSELHAHSQESWEDKDSIFGHMNSLAYDKLLKLELSPRAESLTRAMVLGDRTGISTAQQQRYGLSGASHVLAVSGLHISIIVLLLNIVFMPLATLPRGDILKSLLIIVLIWVYGAVVGFMPSVIRSVIMFSVFQMAWVLGRPYSATNALLFVLLIGVVVAPALLYSVGFQLSVIAVGSIFLWGLPLYYRFFGGGGILVSALCIGFGCSVATMPIVSYTFGYVPILGMLFSPLFIFCAFLIVCCSAIWIILPIGVFAPIVRFLVEMVSMILDNSVQWVTSQSWSSVAWRCSWVEVLLIYLIYIVITALVWSKKDE